MELYFSPMACSLASRIVAYETGADLRFIEVDTRAKCTADGEDYFAVNPMGQVPALRLADGSVLTENPAVLQLLAEMHPEAGLLPDEAVSRARLRQWLSFIGTELHKAVFIPLLDPKAPPDAKAYAAQKASLRLAVLSQHLLGREFLLERYSVADAYATAVLNWAPYAGVDLTPWPAVQQYHHRMTARPHTARAIGEEFELYRAEQKRRAA